MDIDRTAMFARLASAQLHIGPDVTDALGAVFRLYAIHRIASEQNDSQAMRVKRSRHSTHQTLLDQVGCDRKSEFPLALSGILGLPCFPIEQLVKTKQQLAASSFQRSLFRERHIT